ncbi:MAG: cytochrome c, partial [Chthoniobacteraceae bacterium]
QFEKGKALYAAVCGACHQPTGSGLANLAPPLLNSEWVLGPADRPIRAVLHGVAGPITVSGVKFDLEMPGLGAFADEDIAAIVTYIRREWEHGASPVSAADVAQVRELTTGRAKAWTEAELKQPAGWPAEVKPDPTPKKKRKAK